jgi:hypothetical protein
MKPAIMSALLALALTAPSGAIAATITYGSVGITRGSDIDLRYAQARETCSLEAETPPRGTPHVGDFYYRAALRACLYRHGFSAEGEYVYPVPLFGSPSHHRSYYKN